MTFFYFLYNSISWYYLPFLAIILLALDKYLLAPKRKAKKLSNSDKQKPANDAAPPNIEIDKTPFILLGVLVGAINIGICVTGIYNLKWEDWKAYDSMFKLPFMIFSAILFSIAPSIIIYSFYGSKKWKIYKKRLMAGLVLIVTITLHSITCANPSFSRAITQESLINEQKERHLKGRENLKSKILKLHHASKNLRAFDLRMITKSFHQELSNFSSPLSKDSEKRDSIYDRLNYLIGMNFDARYPINPSVLQLFWNSFHVDEIFYSPDYTKFIAIATLDYNRSMREKYNAIIFLGHRNNAGRSRCLSFIESNYLYHKREYAITAALTTLLTDYPDDPNYNYNRRFTGTLLNLKTSEMLPSDLFWSSPNVLKFCKCNYDTCYKTNAGNDYITKKPIFYDCITYIY